MKGRRPGDYFFSRKNGDRILTVKGAFKAAWTRAGIIDFRFHDLRHAAARLLTSEGCDIVKLQHMLGHKTLAITQRYAPLISGRYDKTREIMNRLWGRSNDQTGDTKLTQSGAVEEGRFVTH